MKKIVENVYNKEEKVIVIVMKVVYWLLKEGIVLLKYFSMIRFLKDIGVLDIDFLNVNKYVDYLLYNIVNDFFKLIFNVINNDMIERLRRLFYFIILIDESIDIVNYYKFFVLVCIINLFSF